MNFRSLDALNRVAGLTTNGASANLAYAANLKLKNISYGNNVQQAYTYDSRGRPARITISQLSSTLLDLRYTYDNVGNVLSVYNNTSTESYTFDALNRLKSTTGTWGTLKYGYNATGDRLWMWNSNGSTNTTYSYGATSTSFNRLYSAGSTSYTYDNNGNIKTETTGSVTKYYSYDFENHLTKVTQGSSTLGAYGYSPKGVRVLSIESGSSTVSVSMGVNVIYEKTIGQSTTNDYLFADGLLIVKLSGGTVYHYHQDHLGNTRLVTVGSQIQYSSGYQPYGPAYHPSGTDPVYKYTSKPQSTSTGLYYYGARWYNTTLGRFLTRDPNPGRLSNPQSLNPYAYVQNRAMNLQDPTGMDGCNWWDVVCGWNGLSTDQKALVVTVVVVAVVAASCLVGCEGLLAAPSMLAAGGLDIGMSSLAVGAIGLGTEFAGIGYGSYGIARAGFSLYDSLSGGSASTRVTPDKTTVGDTGGSGFNVVTPVNPGPNMGGPNSSRSVLSTVDSFTNIGGGPKYGEPSRTPDEGRGWGQEKLPKEDPGGASTPWGLICGLSGAAGVITGGVVSAETADTSLNYPLAGGLFGLAICGSAYLKWG